MHSYDLPGEAVPVSASSAVSRVVIDQLPRKPSGACNRRGSHALWQLYARRKNALTQVRRHLLVGNDHLVLSIEPRMIGSPFI